MAGYDPGRYPEVLRWPIREGLLAYVEKLKDDALDDHRTQLILFGLGVGKKPEVPPILR